MDHGVMEYLKKLFQNMAIFFTCLVSNAKISKICKKLKPHDEGRPKQGKKVLPDWADWLSYLAGSPPKHRDFKISSILFANLSFIGTS